MTLLISAQEPDVLRKLGGYSPLCEQLGADMVFMTANGEIIAIQRKAISDLVSSLGERINRELAKMAPADVRVLLIEGQWMWSSEGDSIALPKYGRRFNRKSYDGLIRAVQHAGIWVVTTDHLAHTIEWLTEAGPWYDKRDHVSLSVRGNGPKDMFGGRDHTYQRSWFWQSFEGIGALAAKQLDAWWGGRLPAKWDVTYDEWMKMALSPEKGGCPNIGKKRAQALWDVFNGRQT